MTNLEQLENHPNADIQQQAQEIMDTYFGNDAEDIYDDWMWHGLSDIETDL